MQHRSDHAFFHWAAARKRWRGYAWTEADGSHLRAKEATKVYLVLIDYCHSPQARHFGIGLEGQDRRRKERRLDRAFRSYEKVERGSRQPAVPGPKKARFNMDQTDSLRETFTARERYGHLAFMRLCVFSLAF